MGWKQSKHRWLGWAFDLIAGALVGVSMPGIGPWWLMLPGWSLALSRWRRGGGFRSGWRFGFGWFGVSLYWIAPLLHEYGLFPWVLAIPPEWLLAAWCALFVGAAVWTARWLASLPSLSSHHWWILPVAIVAFEELRGVVLSGFPWAPLTLPLTAVPAWLAPSRWVGASGLALLLLWLIAAGVEAGAGRRRRGPVVLSAVLAVAWLAAMLHLSALQAPQQALKIGIIQGNIEQELKWTPEMKDMTIHIYEDLSRRATTVTDLDLVVWPETAMPFFFQNPGPDRTAVRNIARELGAHLLFGAPAYWFPPGRNEPILFNRAWLLNPDGREVGTYDKVHLVPFGEYVPYENLLFFVRKLVPGVGEFQPGQARNLLEVADQPFGVLICYEVIFSDEVAEFARSGARWLVQLTNDAWFGDTAAPWQHLAQAQLRAVETGLPIVRAANTGISAWIDRTGEIRRLLDLDRRDVLIAYPRPSDTAPYVAVAALLHGFWLMCTLGMFACAIWQRRRMRQAVVALNATPNEELDEPDD